jgi:hypothetical protein
MTMLENLVSCPCGSVTLPTFVRCDNAGAVTNCWIALDPDGRARPGCHPDERTAEIIPRRNARLDAALSPLSPERPVYRGGAKVRCACGLAAYVLTTNLNALADPSADLTPLDPSVPVMATSCWLAIAEDGGPQEGCSPDSRTWDVLARARGLSEPKAEVILEALPTLRPSDEARLALLELRANAGRREKPKPVEAAPPPEETEGRELSLFG